MIAEQSDENPFHISPDGSLALSAIDGVDGEKQVGFHGFDWKLEVSALSTECVPEPEEALEQFIEDVLEDRSIIAVLSKHGEMIDVWVTEDPKSDRSYVRDGEELHFRFWSGIRVVEQMP